MGNDHRTRVTKILIRKAFTDLLKKSPSRASPLRSCAKRPRLTEEPSTPTMQTFMICWKKWKRK